MRRIVLQNRNQGSRGVTLVEVLVSIVILLIVSMGLLQASLLTIQSNVRNELRDEAVKIASEDMANSRQSFVAANSTSNRTVTRTFRNQKVDFSSTTVVSNLDTVTNQVTVTVTWLYRGEPFTHSIMSIVRNQ